LLPLVIENKPLSLPVAATIHRLLDRLDPIDLVRLDEQVRNLPFSYQASFLRRWQDISPADLKRFPHSNEYATLVFGMSSFHHSGYVREEAVRQLAKTRTGEELPFLLIRINDWVPNVRRITWAAVRDRLTATYARHFVHNLALVLRLTHCGRADHGGIVDSVIELLQKAEFSELKDRLESTDPFIRRTSFRIALDTQTIDRQAVIRQGMQSKDNVVRLLSLEKTHLLADDAALSLLTEMRNDGFAPIRREVLGVYLRRFPGLAERELEEALCDTHTSIRRFARFHLEKTGQMDFAEFYRRALSEEPKLYAAIRGIGETGEASDVQLLLPFLTHSVPKVRRAVIGALSKLNPDEHRDTFLHMLHDPSPKVSRESVRGLGLCTPYLVSAPRLWKEFEVAAEQHTQRNVLFLISRQPKWDSLYYLLLALSLDDREIAHLALHYIHRWLSRFNRTFTVPKAYELEQLGEALTCCGARLDEHSREELKFILQGFAQRVGR
jgi:HEAT repeat protein